ncbi:MAG: diguanylate cyclase, partial [Microcystaceae cyanobacterium]
MTISFPNLHTAILRNPTVVSPDTPIQTAIAAMCDHSSLNCLIVEENQVVIGILTPQNLLKELGLHSSLDSLNVGQLMKTSVIILRESQLTDIFTLIHYLGESSNYPLPIVDDNERLVGLITSETLEEALRLALLNSQEQIYQQALAAITDSVFVKEANYRLLCANKAFRDYYGMTVKELHGMIDSPFKAPDDTQGELQDNPLIIRQEEPTISQNRELSRLNSAKSPILDPDQQTTMSVDVAINVTEQRHEQVEKIFQSSILEQIHDSVVVTDLDGIITHWNSRSEAMFGYSASEVSGQHIKILYFAKDHELLETSVISPLQKQGIWAKEMCMCIRCKSGQPLDVHLRLSLLRNTQGKIIGMIGCSNDITQQKEAEKKLKEAQRLAKLGYWELNHQNNKLGWSDEVFRIFELDAQRFVPSYQTFLNRVHPDDIAQVNQAYTQHLENKTPYEIVHRLLMPDQRIKFVIERCQTFYDSQGNPIRSVGTVQDITERQKVENILKNIIEGTVATIGQDFFQALVRYIAQTLEKPFVIISELIDNQLTTLAFWKIDQLVPNITYPILKTPCEIVLADGKFSCHQDIQSKFPEDPDLSFMAAESYVGLALTDQNNCAIGNICILDTKPINEEMAEIIEQILQVFAGRASVELQRKRSDEALRNLNEELLWQANHDPLTGLVNRHYFEHKLDHLKETVLLENNHHVVAFLDLDHFKLVNDICGHSVGDICLCQVTHLIQTQIRSGDTLARLGGDEFALLFHQCSLDKANEISQNIQQSLADFRFNWQNKLFKIGVSMGLVEMNSHFCDRTPILKAADSACYLAKNKGRNRIEIYKPDGLELLQQKKEQGRSLRLRQALDEDSFCLLSQSIIPTFSSKLSQSQTFLCEILLRLVEPSGQMISPSAFIPIAERYDLITEIDRWVVHHAFTSILEKTNSCCSSKQISRNLKYNINLSGKTVEDEQFLSFLEQQFEQFALPPQSICFEITETSVISNFSQAVEFITTVKNWGCQFALDDFGSGMCSFNY